jgi:acetyl esterase
MPLDPGLAALAEELKARGLRALSPVTSPIAECRDMQSRIAAVVNEGSVPLARERDIAVPRAGGVVPCRLYLPDGAHNPPLIIYAHGGSFAQGSLNAWDGMLRELTRASGVAALSVDYRLAPEHRFPAGFDDLLAVVHYASLESAALGIDASRLAIGGDSAGGNLALAAAVALRDAGASPLKFMLLVYGVYSTDNTTPAWATYGNGSLTAAQMDWIWATYLNSPAEKSDTRVAPILASMAGLPPAHLMVGDLDPLQDDSRALAAKFAAAHVTHTLNVYEGLPHGCIRSGNYSATVRRALADGADALARAMR